MRKCKFKVILGKCNAAGGQSLQKIITFGVETGTFFFFETRITAEGSWANDKPMSQP